jgi:hypothetical protein
MVRVHRPLFVFNPDFLRVELQKVSSDGECFRCIVIAFSVINDDVLITRYPLDDVDHLRTSSSVGAATLIGQG